MLVVVDTLESRTLFSVPPAVASLSLINADTNRPVPGYESLPSSLTLDLAKLPTRHLSLRANAAAATPGSIRFKLDANAAYATENVAPYVIAGDLPGNDILPWKVPLGSHTITATPYEFRAAGGTAGAAKTVKLNVIDSGSVVVPPPASSGKTYVVDPAGSLRTIGSAAALARPGDVVLINPGTYRERINLPRSGTADAPITLAARTPGTVTVNGVGQSYVLGGNVSYIDVTGITFDGCDNGFWEPAVRANTGWELTDVTVRRADGPGVGVAGRGARLTRVTAEYNGQEGITGDGCVDVVLRDCVTRYNNTGVADPVWKGQAHAVQQNGLWYVDPTWEAGAGKWTNTDRVTLDGVRSYGNRGPGIWFDYNNTNVTVRNCSSHDNGYVLHSWEAMGINLELTQGPVLLENNTAYNNAGGNLVVQSSRSVTARGNTFTGGYVLLKDWPRGDAYTTRNLTFTGNRFVNMSIRTEDPSWNAGSGAAKHVRFDGNTYVNPPSPVFWWGSTGRYSTLASIRSTLGFEWNGTFA